MVASVRKVVREGGGQPGTRVWWPVSGKKAHGGDGQFQGGVRDRGQHVSRVWCGQCQEGV